jgi:uncharacterized protein YkwD
MFLLAALSACSGGGGSSPATSPGSPVTPPPTVQPPPTPTAAPAIASGQIVDEKGAPVAGATVSFGSGFQHAPAAALIGVAGQAVTDANGRFTMIVPAAPTFAVQIVANGRLVAHKLVTGTPGLDQLQPWLLPIASADELAGLAALNADRAALGKGAGALPVSLDADAELVARTRAADMALNGYFDHVAPGATMAAADVAWKALPNSLYVPFGPTYVLQENIAAGSVSLVTAEYSLVYMDADPKQAHRLNVLSQGNMWVGLGEAFNGKSSIPGGGPVNYFAENFVTTCENPCP